MINSEDLSFSELSQSSVLPEAHAQGLGFPVLGSKVLPQVLVKVPSGIRNIFMAIPPIARPSKIMVNKITCIFLVLSTRVQQKHKDFV